MLTVPTVPLVFAASKPNRRGSFRAPLGGAVTLTARDRLVDSVALDLSEGGLRLMSRLRLAAGEVVSIVFFVNGELVSVTGSVRWTGTTKLGLHTFGVRFDAIEEDGAALIAAYCRRAMS